MNAYFYLVLLLTTTGYALLRGGAPERIVAVLILSAVGASALAISFSDRLFATREVGLFTVDLILCVAVLAVALLAERFWPLWLSALLILSALLQLAIWYAPHYYRIIYLVLHALSAYPTLILLSLGTLRHQCRLRRHGQDPPWLARKETQPRLVA